VGRVDGQFVVNPTLQEQEKSDLYLVVAGTRDAVTMVEAGANEIPEDIILEAIKFGHEEVKRLATFQEEIAKQVGRPKREFSLPEPDPQVDEWVRSKGTARLDEALRNSDKLSREEDVDSVRLALLEEYAEEFGEEVFLQKQREIETSRRCF